LSLLNPRTTVTLAIAIIFPNRNHDLKFLLETKEAIAIFISIQEFRNYNDFSKVLKERYFPSNPQFLA
jgi:hypothetical protein